jgi:hypothetical protein
MRSWIWMTVMGLCLTGWQAMAQELEERKENAPPPPRLRLTDEAISKAVRETLLEEGRSDAGAGTGLGIKREQGKALSADASYQKFERGFSEAQKPGCLGPDATRFQPSGTVVNTPLGKFNVGVGGIFALPFWAAAIARGKCN